MKKIYTLLFTCACALMASAQSLIISQSLELVPMSSALAQYNNQFGYKNNPDLDDPFPYAVVCMNLTGDVKVAKSALNLDLGTMLVVEGSNRDIENTILFLVPVSAKNIYLTCGEGCEKQLLWNRGRLQSNKVYTCKVSYEKAKLTGSASDEQMQAMMEQVQAMQKENDQHVADLEQKLAAMQKNPQSGSTTYSKPSSVAKDIKGNGMATIYRRSAIERHQGGIKLPPYMYNGEDMDNRALKGFLKNNSPAAYAAYKKGNVAIGVGSALLVAGVGLVGGGLGYMFLTDEKYYDSKYFSDAYDRDLISSFVMMGVGGASLLAGVITIPVGVARRNKAYKVFNYEQVRKSQAQVTLGVSTSQNGVGLAMQF